MSLTVLFDKLNPSTDLALLSAGTGMVRKTLPPRALKTSRSCSGRHTGDGYTIRSRQGNGNKNTHTYAGQKTSLNSEHCKSNTQKATNNPSVKKTLGIGDLDRDSRRAASSKVVAELGAKYSS